jgi:hypothetical protein
MDPSADCTDCIGNFAKQWKVDEYTGWSSKNYTYEKFFNYTPVYMTPLQKALHDYDLWKQSEQYQMPNITKDLPTLFPERVYGRDYPLWLDPPGNTVPDMN